jgi:hypothetical protein
MAAEDEVNQEQEYEVVEEQKTLGYDNGDNEDGEEEEHEEAEGEEQDVQGEGEMDVDELDVLHDAVFNPVLSLANQLMDSGLMASDHDGRNILADSLQNFMTKKQAQWDQSVESMRTNLAFLKDKDIHLSQVISRERF